MSRFKITDHAKAIAQTRGLATIVASEEQIEEQIKSYPALWIKPCGVVEGVLTTVDRVRYELEMTLLIEASHNRYTDQARKEQEATELLLSILEELATEDEVLLIEEIESSTKRKIFATLTPLAVSMAAEIVIN